MDNKNLANSLFMKISPNTDFSNNNILGYSRDKLESLENKYNLLKENQTTKKEDVVQKTGQPKELNDKFSLIIDDDESRKIKYSNFSYLNPSLLMKKSKFHDSIYKKHLSLINSDGISNTNSNLNIKVTDNNSNSISLNLKENENTQNKNNRLIESIKKSSNELFHNESSRGRKICLNENLNSRKVNDGNNSILNTKGGVLHYIDYTKKIIRTKLICSNPMISIEKELADSCTVFTIKNYIKNYIEENFNESIKSIELIFNNIIIDDDNVQLKEFYNYTIDELMEKRSIKSLKSSNSDLSLTSNSDHCVYFRFDIKYMNDENNTINSNNKIAKSMKNMRLDGVQENLKLGINKKKKLVMQRDLPIIKNFKTIPDIVTICRMSYDEIENIYNFTVYNEYGSIKFLGVTNLCKLNIDEIIDIKENYIEVYHKRLSQNKDLPEIGTELNKNAEITLFNISYNEDIEMLEEFIKKLKNKILSMNGKFIKYDVNKKHLIFSFDHFNFKK